MITRLLLIALAIGAIFAGHGCALTNSNRFSDRAQAAQANLYSPAMEARIAAAVHP